MTFEGKPDLAEILVLEEAVWTALVTGDPDQDRALLLPGFLGVYPSGFSDREGHVSQLHEGPSIARFELSEARLLPVGPDHVMLIYHATYCRAGRDEDEAMYVSSLWQRTPEGWRNLFSQDTPVAD